ncbi:sensor domain-containing diguanylate cyclase [Rhodococcus sp. H36-A4]|uniref:sensor domain-containing diguanylate cyclase n=1 Tax=Rhodococcus sp. H36-A4 TaxID=3004353 RepID=UPI0022AF5232|nr:sensor domain-containing diguanylate cyclase [Rhodococcus sp. H36-A4]MCZ4079941.1 sensor domain-containing diguanylate cyclase [Rhodococcus sp. H36-A4]
MKSFKGVDEHWYRALFDASTVAIALADEQGLLMAANDAYCAMVQRTWGEIAGRSSREFTHPDDLAQHAAMAQLMAGAREQGQVLRLEKRYVRPDGTLRWAWVSAVAVTSPDGRTWTASVIHDTTERRIAEDMLHAAATTDPLTGLLNRRGWREGLHRLRYPPHCADSLILAMIDLDRFKAYNDTHGHPAGDQLLTTFSAAARGILGPQTLFARWGGEEFALALPGIDVMQARRILTDIAAVVPDGQQFSAGFTALQQRETLFDCFDRADVLLYRAKRDGGGRMYDELDDLA